MGLYQADFRAVRAFAQGDGPGELVYARGAALHGGPIAGAVRGLIDAGVVQANFRRGASGEGEYLITRRTAMGRDGARLRAVRRGGPRLDEIERAVLRLLKRYARAGQELPTNRSIAARCGCKSRHDASYRIRKLAGFGLIEIETMGETRLAKMPARVGEGECSSLQD